MRAVFDTGVVLSALVFPQGRLSWVLEAWRSRMVVPLVNRETSEELIRALGYRKFALDAGEIQILLSAYLPYAEAVSADPTERVRLPRCRDPHDQVFLELAAAGGAEMLVASDRALLDLAGRTPFRILSPAQLKRVFKGTR